jgi:dienelactone hydrolase
MAIQLAASRMPSADGVETHLDEAAALVNAKDFLSIASVPEISFGLENAFAFPSPLPSPYEENNQAVGRLHRAGADWQKKPTAILVHGWNDATSHFVHFPMLAKKMNLLGLNVATLELPYHFQRRPRQRLGPASNFLSADILRVAQAAAQSVAEIRALTQWLKAQGSPRIGLLGVSLGGWLGGLTACHEPQLNALALVVPATRLDRLIEDLAFCQSIRAALRGRKIDFGRLDLFAAPPLVSKENMLLVEAVHDGFMPRETTEELWQRWDRPEIWRLPIGHITVFWKPGLIPRLASWFATKLDVPVAK